MAKSQKSNIKLSKQLRQRTKDGSHSTTPSQSDQVLSESVHRWEDSTTSTSGHHSQSREPASLGEVQRCATSSNNNR